MTTLNDNEVETRAQDERSRSAADRVRDTASTARAKASDAYSAALDRTRAAYGSARERASDAFENTRDGIEANPVAAVVGGLAIGAILAAVLPRSQRETETLGKLGERLNDSVRTAAKSAREAGVAKLDEFGVNAVKEKLAGIAGGNKTSD